MKILHIISGLGDGGAEAVLFRLCASDRSCQHIVVSMGKEEKYSRLLREIEIPVIHLNMARGRVRISDFIAFFNVLRDVRPDVVQTWMYHADFFGALIARLSKIRSVCWGVHNTNLVVGRSRISTILISRVNSILSYILPARIIYCAYSARVAHQTIGYCKDIGRVVYNGYELEKFRPNQAARDKLRQELGFDNGDFVIGLVARFDPMKDHRNFCLALQELQSSGRDVKVIMAGAGIDQNNSDLSNLLTTSNIRGTVTLLGPRGDIDELMSAFDVCVLSSMKEAFPNVLAEAMACGVPCVSTDVGDAREIIGATGWVVPAGDPVLLSQAITEAMTEHACTDRWAIRQENARERIRQSFSLEKMVDAYKQVWRELV